MMPQKGSCARLRWAGIARRRRCCWMTFGVSGWKGKGVRMYEGRAHCTETGGIEIRSKGKLELCAEEGESELHSRSSKATYYLAWEHEDLGHPSYRYRGEPEPKDYDWAK